MGGLPEIEDAGLGHDARSPRRRIVACRRPRREVPARRVADGDDAVEVERAAAATSARASIAAATSSSVTGYPPPLPTRRYSMFSAAQPRAGSVAASGRPSDRSYFAARTRRG